MKRLLWFGKLLFFLLVVVFLFRSVLFHNTVKYHPTGERAAFAIHNPDLRQFLNEQPVDTSVEKIIRRSLDLTANHLRFSTGQSEVDPNLLIRYDKAHCVGYAAFFTTTCKELLRNAGLDQKVEVKHLRGKISFLGIDLHQFFDDPFSYDHDYNEVYDKRNGKRVIVDASVKDILGIAYISGQ